MLLPLPVPSGDAVRDLLPTLAEALAGRGPAWFPVPASTRTAAAPPLPAGIGLGDPLAATEDDPDDPTVLVVPTSGSTGGASGVLLPPSALLASARATQERLGGPGDWLLALPAHHIAGLQVLLRAAGAGTGLTVLDVDMPFTAARFAAAVTAMSGSRRYVSLVPTQLTRILLDPEATAALAGFDAVLVGGAATPPVLAGRARAAGVRLHLTYGMTETCGGCVYDGRPLAGVRTEVDPDGRVLLTGPMVARGYHGRPADPAFPRPGTHRTNDRGEIVDGELHVLGRMDDMILTGGLKVPPVVLEDALASLPGVAAAAVVGPPDPEWGQRVCAVLVPDGSRALPTLDELRELLRGQGLAAALLPRQIVVLDSLPVRGPGKPDRVALLALADR
ncbi:AMP-binding protein [Nakamurella flavida]|uniref:AMP-binding protein n=1 Tax=Nakamurella flavida TaxID=363630 RepID=A0A938YLV3_9ACTN|nr:AMP-binding protein [Nakamurella flavida]